MNKDIHQMRMQEALKLAQKAFEEDEVPVGCVIYKDNHIIAKAHNQVERLKDPTAHAEIIAITQATNTLDCKWLEGCSMYVTIEPCSMCAGALVLARIKHLCIGAMDPKAGGCGSVMNIIQHNGLNHKIDALSGICEDECGQLMTSFFKQKRKNRLSELN